MMCISVDKQLAERELNTLVAMSMLYSPIGIPIHLTGGGRTYNRQVDYEGTLHWWMSIEEMCLALSTTVLVKDTES